MANVLSINKPHIELKNSTRDIQFGVVIAALVFLAYLFTTYRVAENLQTLGVLALFGVLALSGTRANAWFLWMVVTMTLLAGIIARPLDVPNHHFMMTYLAAALSLSLSAPAEERSAHLQNNARWLLIVLMGLATIQKLLSPAFMDGSYISYEIVGGGFAGPVLGLFGETSAITTQNRELITQLRAAPPEALESVQFQSPFPQIPLLAYSFVALILFMEAWLCFAFWRFPQKLITHLSLIAFALTLGVLRQEFTFISVVCVLGLFSCDPSRKWLRVGYATSAIVFAACVLKTLNYGAL